MQVFHMDMPKDQEPAFNQMRHVGTGERFERMCLELIGDFATYEPQGKTILVEGGTKFDQEMVTRLFTAELRGVNVASIAGKNEVIKKKNELWKLQELQGISKEVVTITDGDGIPPEKRVEDEKKGEFRWDLYDIESYLLDAAYISQAVGQITLRRAGEIPVRSVETLLRNSAQEVIQELINSRIVEYVRRKLNKQINLNIRRPNPRGRITTEDIERLVAGSRDAATAIYDTVQAITKEELETELSRLWKSKTLLTCGRLTVGRG